MLYSDDEKCWYSQGYQRLGQYSIRLLSIKPGFPSEPIECSFVHVNRLDEAPPYDALSYVWGTQQNSEPIICNGVEVTVTKNLADALKHLRRYPGWDSVVQWPNTHPLHSSRNVWGKFATNRNEYGQSTGPEQETLLWVDALCINQLNNLERASQVKMMGKIYARASRVRIWFKKEDTRPVELIEPILKPATLNRSSYYLGLYGRMPICLSFIAQALKHTGAGRNRLAATRPAEDSAHRNVAYGFPPPSAPEWDIVRDFFMDPWFQRVWVVQEAILPATATVLVGNWEINWAAIGRAATWFQEKGYSLPAVLRYQMRDPQDFLPIPKAASMWELCSWPDRKIPLLNLLREFRNRLATNPVDKVYATFGMAEELSSVEEDGFHQLVEPSYTKEIVDVYRDVAKFLIIEHGDLLVLSHAAIQPAASDWPSWVPDWRCEKSSNEISTPRCADTYSADGGHPLTVGVSNVKNGLVLQGIEVDIIRAYGDKLKSYGFAYRTYQEEIDFIQTAWTLFARRPTNLPSPYANKDTADIFIRTLTAGLSTKYKPASNDPAFFDDTMHWFSVHAPGLLFPTSIQQRLKWFTTQSVDSGRFHEAFVRTCIDRRFFVTKDGRMGIGPDAMKEDDIMVILFGGKVPYILRPSAEGYRFIGECYVPGLMEGEAVETWRRDGKKTYLFELY